MRDSRGDTGVDEGAPARTAVDLPDRLNLEENESVVPFDSFEPTSRHTIKQFESRIGLALPADYKIFLEQHNGGIFHGALFAVPKLGTDEALDILYGFIDSERSLDLRFWQKEMEGEIPENSIIIGTDPGGNTLVLDNEGIYYWDHEHYYPQTSNKKNADKVAGSFTEFMTLLRPPEE